jgi:hypothetical protein
MRGRLRRAVGFGGNDQRLQPFPASRFENAQGVDADALSLREDSAATRARVDDEDSDPRVRGNAELITGRPLFQLRVVARSSPRLQLVVSPHVTRECT